ncbi:MAG: DUF3110 domain-containing protein [Cyanobacteria bacterium P01_A01_bin.84]
MITPMRVFVLLFNAGTDSEGIHTIKVGDRNKVLMFESEEDAERFALMLEAQDFPTPTVEEIDAEEIKEFCTGANYDWEIVPSNGSLIIPPEANIEDTDWQIDEQKNQPPSNQEETPTESEMSDTELESIRRKLEGLL